MDLLSSLYHECHEHLRDADKKRDELIGFFAVVVGLLFAAYKEISDDLRAPLCLVIALVGLFVVLAVLQYRKWHTIYTHCFMVLQELSRKEAKIISRTDVVSAWSDLKISKTYWSKGSLLNPLNGTEGATFWALLVLSFLPWYLLVRALHKLALFHASNDIVGFLIGLTFYILIMCIVGMAVLYRADKKEPFEHWILRPFDKDI